MGITACHLTSTEAGDRASNCHTGDWLPGTAPHAIALVRLCTPQSWHASLRTGGNQEHSLGDPGQDIPATRILLSPAVHVRACSGKPGGSAVILMGLKEVGRPA